MYVVKMVYNENNKWVENNISTFANKKHAIQFAKQCVNEHGGIVNKIDDTDFLAKNGTSFHVNEL